MNQFNSLVKRIILTILPKTIYRVYKKNRYFKLLKNFDINQEPDIKVAQCFINSENCVLDIGANFGLYTFFISPLAKIIYSIEPIPETFEILRSNVQRLSLQNVITMNFAVSDKNTIVTMGIPKQASGLANHFRARIIRGDDNKEYRSVNVPSVTIDSEFSDIAESICFVKCDVEGHELASIQGAKKFLKMSKAAWLIEVSGDPDEKGTSAHQLFDIFSCRGFKVFWFDGLRLKPRKHGEKNINFFFLLDLHLEILRKQNPMLLPSSL